MLSSGAEPRGEADRAAADIVYMRSALALARRALGVAWPNPAVGCVLVQPGPDGGRVVGRGWTQRGGRPHGEAEALRRAGAAARGATAYISLEPCNHHGRAPPCAAALVAAGVARAVITTEDPDPRVSGRGVAHLRGAGVETVTGVGAGDARALNEGFFLRVAEGRPLVTLKLATSLDGRIAAAGGKSRWITGEAARERAHLLRASHDAVMVGIGTALADDPLLTCRLPGMEDRSPVRVVLDSRLRLPPAGRLVASADAAPVWLVTPPGGDRRRRRTLEDLGVRVIEAEADAAGRVDVRAALRALGAAGLTRLLVEGGGTLAASLLAADLVDRIAWLRAGSIIGGDGVPAVAPVGVAAPGEAPAFERTSVVRCGPDLLETCRRRA